MARRIYSYKNPVRVNICKINTDRIRALPHKQLDDLGWAIGRLHDLPKRPTKKWSKAQILLVRFVRELVYSHGEEHYWRLYPGISPSDAEHQRSVIQQMRKYAAEDANKIERQIWDEQAKAKCKISDYELVARDAERSGRHDIAKEIRASRRQHRTPHRRPAKISGRR